MNQTPEEFESFQTIDGGAIIFHIFHNTQYLYSFKQMTIFYFEKFNIRNTSDGDVTLTLIHNNININNNKKKTFKLDYKSNE